MFYSDTSVRLLATRHPPVWCRTHSECSNLPAGRGSSCVRWLPPLLDSAATSSLQNSQKTDELCSLFADAAASSRGISRVAVLLRVKQDLHAGLRWWSCRQVKYVDRCIFSLVLFYNIIHNFQTFRLFSSKNVDIIVGTARLSLKNRTAWHLMLFIVHQHFLLHRWKELS